MTPDYEKAAELLIEKCDKQAEQIKELEIELVNETSMVAKSYTACGNYQQRIGELEAELKQHRWIPVTEKLPENIADVFILTGGGSGKGSGGIGMYGEEPKGVFGWERLDHAINLNITHWKPIILP